MRRILSITALLLTINVLSIDSKDTSVDHHLENFYNDNSLIIEWANDKSGKCQAYSIYEDDVLLKSNIPIMNKKIIMDDLSDNHSGKITLKCDSFVKSKRKVNEDEWEASSQDESDSEDDSVINDIDNIYISSDNDKEEKESTSFFEKIFGMNKAENKDNNHKTASDKNNTNENNKNNNKTTDDKNDDNKESNNKDSDNDDNNDKNDKDYKNSSDNNKDISDDSKGNNKSKENKNNDKDNDDDDKDKDGIKPIQLGVGISLSLLFTGGMFLSVMKMRKMSNFQLEINAQEMSANSIYVPSPGISSSGSMSMSMSSIDLGRASSIQDHSAGSSLNSFIV